MSFKLPSDKFPVPKTRSDVSSRMIIKILWNIILIKNEIIENANSEFISVCNKVVFDDNDKSKNIKEYCSNWWKVRREKEKKINDLFSIIFEPRDDEEV